MCAWPEPKYRLVRAESLKVGDFIHRYREDARRSSQSTAQVVYFHTNPGPGTVTLRIWIQRRNGRSLMKDLHGWSDDQVMALRAGDICGQWACEAHVREVDEYRAYCREHWNAWENVA